MSSHRYWRALSLPLLLALLAGAVITTGRSPVAEVSAQPAGARLARLPFGAAADTGPRTVAPFRMVGVSWPADAAAGAVQAPVAVEVRVRREGAWTGWQRLHVDGDREDGAARRLATSPVWVGEGGADGVQARFVGRVPRRAEVVLVEPGSGPAYAPVAALPGSPSLVTRAGWGTDETLRTEHPDPTCTGTPDYGTTVRAAFVHHTFHSATGSNDYTADESDDIVRGIYSSTPPTASATSATTSSSTGSARSSRAGGEAPSCRSSVATPAASTPTASAWP